MPLVGGKYHRARHQFLAVGADFEPIIGPKPAFAPYYFHHRFPFRADV